MVSRGLLFKDIGSSLISVLLGFLIGFVTAVPVAFLMAWYRPVRFIIEPWIQFIRNIPPLAYVPLVVIGVGVGRTPQVIVIWLATFLTMTVTIFQGVINVDETLIKAARVLGAKDSDLFVKVNFPSNNTIYYHSYPSWYFNSPDNTDRCRINRCSCRSWYAYQSII